MQSLEERIIELSKVKIVLLLLGAIIFVVVGAWFLTWDAQTIENACRFNSPTLAYGIGVFSMLFFGLCGLVGIKKLFDKSPGLVLNSEGILDNSSGLSAGLIPWSEVVDIEQYQVRTQKFVSIHVKDPGKYANIGNALKKMANRVNIKMCGTPINISANSLKIGHEYLLKTIQEYYQKNRSNV